MLLTASDDARLVDDQPVFGLHSHVGLMWQGLGIKVWKKDEKLSNMSPEDFVAGAELIS